MVHLNLVPVWKKGPGFQDLPRGKEGEGKQAVWELSGPGQRNWYPTAVPCLLLLDAGYLHYSLGPLPPELPSPAATAVRT